MQQSCISSMWKVHNAKCKEESLSVVENCSRKAFRIIDSCIMNLRMKIVLRRMGESKYSSTLSIIEICPIELRDDNLVHLRVETELRRCNTPYIVLHFRVASCGF